MTTRAFAACSIGLMTLGRLADTLVTYSYTPGLELEANPLASVLGLGWPTLLTVNLLVVVGIAACTMHWARRPRQYEPCAEVHDLWSFASFACYGRVYPPLKFLRRRLLTPPTERGHTLHLIGAVMPVTITVVSGVALFSWEAVYGHPWEGYSQFYTTFWPLFPYGVVIPTIWIAGVFFYRHEFRRYQQRCAVKSESQEPSPETLGTLDLGH
jgi:hypothetical protein